MISRVTDPNPGNGKYIGMRFSKKPAAVVVITALTGAALVALDTHDYRVAKSQLNQAMQSEVQRSTLDADMNAIRTCTSLINSSDDLNNAWRDCAVRSAVTTRSVEAAILFAQRAYEWLHKNPDDKAMYDAAVSVLSAGWADHAAKEPVYAALEKVDAAHRNSVVLRMLAVPADTNPWRPTYTKMLETAEIAIMAPKAHQKQVARKRAEALKS